MVDEAVRYAHLDAASTAINRGGQAKLHRVVINTPENSTDLTIYESASAAGSVVGIIDCATAGTYEYGLTLSGLTVQSNGVADITVVYQ